MRFCGGDVDVDVGGGGGSGMVEGWLYFVVKLRYRGEGREVDTRRMNLAYTRVGRVSKNCHSSISELWMSYHGTSSAGNKLLCSSNHLPRLNYVSSSAALTAVPIATCHDLII